MFKDLPRTPLIGAVVGVSLLISSISQAQNAPRLSLAEQNQMIKMLERQVFACMPPMTNQTSVKLLVRVKRDGTLDGHPEIVSATPVTAGGLVLRAFLRCVTPRSPLHFPPEKYADWKVFYYNFADPAH